MVHLSHLPKFFATSKKKEKGLPKYGRVSFKAKRCHVFTFAPPVENTLKQENQRILRSHLAYGKYDSEEEIPASLFLRGITRK